MLTYHNFMGCCWFCCHCHCCWVTYLHSWGLKILQVSLLSLPSILFAVAQAGRKKNSPFFLLAGQFSRTRVQIFQLATRSGLMIPDMKERKRNNAQPGWFWGTLPMLSSDFCIVVFRNNFMGFKDRGSLRVRGMSLHRWHPSFFRRCRRRTPRVYQRRWVSKMPVIWFLCKCDEMESSWTLHF